MLSFNGWIEETIINQNEHVTDDLLNELLDYGVPEHNFDEILTHNVNRSEHKVLNAAFCLHWDTTDSYFQACCDATEHNDETMYQIILPLVVSCDWGALENYLLERSLFGEYQLLQEHKSRVQRATLQKNLSCEKDDPPRKI